MALPSSGAIDLDQIYDEAVAGGYSGARDMQSLAIWGGWSTGPDGIMPHGMSDFYGASIASSRVSNLAVSIGPTESLQTIASLAHVHYPINHGDGYIVGVWQKGQNQRRAFVVHEDGSGNLSTSYILLSGTVDQSSSYTHAVAASNESYYLVCSTYEATTASANDSIGVWCVERSGTTLTENASISFTDGTSMLCVDMCFLGEDTTNDYFLICYSRNSDIKLRAVIVNKSTLAMSFGATETVSVSSTHDYTEKITIVSTENNGSTGRFSILISNGSTSNYYPYCTYLMGTDSYAIYAIGDLPESGTGITTRFAQSGWENLMIRGVVHPDKGTAILDDQVLVFMPSGSTDPSSTIAKPINRSGDSALQFEPGVTIDGSSDSYLAIHTSTQLRFDYNLIGDQDMGVAFVWISSATGAITVKVSLLVNGSNNITLVPDATVNSIATGDNGSESMINITAIRKNKFLLTWRDNDQSGFIDMALVTVTPT